MKNLKRILLVGMVVVFAMVCFMACGQQAGTPGDGDTGGEAAGTVSIGDANDEYYMITFMNGLEFWKDCYRGFEDAAKIYGAKTVYTGAQEFDINQQITVLEQVLAKNPAGIAITCVNDEALMEPINKAIEQGVEVVVFDSDSPESDRYSILQTGNANAGSKAADQMAEALGGTGEVGVIYTAGTPTHEARAQGIKDAIEANYPNMTVVAEGNYDGEQADASRAVSAMLQGNPNIKGVFAVNSPGGLGAATAVREAGLSDSVKVIAFDHDETVYQAIKDGSIYATVKQGAYNMGFWSMQFLFATKNNLVNPVDGWRENGLSPLPPYVDTGVDIVTAENLDAFYQG